jgi:hypothetical protein
MNKQDLAEKLFSANTETGLSTEEIIFICKNLPDDSKTVIPYNHEAPDSMEACGVRKEDADKLNKLFKDSLNSDNKPVSLSRLVEKAEALIHTDDRFLRMMIIQCIMFADERQNDPIQSC